MSRDEGDRGRDEPWQDNITQGSRYRTGSRFHEACEDDGERKERKWRRKEPQTSQRKEDPALQRGKASSYGIGEGDRETSSHTPTPPQGGNASKEGWKMVNSKRQRPPNHSPRKERKEDWPIPQRRSPPTIRTPAGTIVVCGRFPRPSCGADNVAVWRLTVIGDRHKGKACQAKRRETVLMASLHKERNPQDKLMKPKESKSGNTAVPKPHCKLNPNAQQQPKTPVRKLAGMKTAEEEGPENLYISVPIDSDVIEGRRRMQRFSIIIVTGLRVVDASRLRRPSRPWTATWEVKPLRDKRFIVAFPSAELARQTESKGPLHQFTFSLELEPWTPDQWNKGNPEGASRWVVIKQLPMDCWSRDLVARLLKPAGDLIYVSSQSRDFGDDLLVLLRVRRPRRLPSSIHCSMGHRKYNYHLELAPGQPALPWQITKQPDHGDLTTSLHYETAPKTDKVYRNAEQPPDKEKQVLEQPPEYARDRGKAIMIEEEERPTWPENRRSKGVVIGERRSCPGNQRSKDTTPTPLQPVDGRPASKHGRSDALQAAPVHGGDALGPAEATAQGAMGLGDDLGSAEASAQGQMGLERVANMEPEIAAVFRDVDDPATYLA
ncbi:hypothetical protein J5N97_020975 [Dioscorea zingiberensis]|uniref:DUF4283 domain-containing protein n=1 Tax=Dioscorea zingiberensis TaxID=325984 RepID=A0A9D5CGT8_9LILI|nr:hypothetical protein J5N97_020975 [Dioscorea zingiberensis]